MEDMRKIYKKKVIFSNDEAKYKDNIFYNNVVSLRL